MAAWKGLLDLSVEEFEQAWRVSCYGAFLCSREALSDMLESGSGAILFTGANSSIRGRDGALASTSSTLLWTVLSIPRPSGSILTPVLTSPS
jgi:NAD(P)-dependent dehydrogenase (short-subunit alcohol dehydrogenase family)